MRCKLHDHVIVIDGAAAGASGTIVAASPWWVRSSGIADWEVEFPEPVSGWDGSRRTSGTCVHHRDDELLPVNPPADPVDTETEREIEVVA